MSESINSTDMAALMVDDTGPFHSSPADDSDTSFDTSFDADVPIPSIETSGRCTASSPRRLFSNTAPSSISDIPSDFSLNRKDASPFSPRKDRAGFRNPSSVKALQMASPSISPRHTFKPGKGHKQLKLPSPSRPRSARSTHSERFPEPTSSETPTRQPADGGRKNCPLVLLHVTLLPVCPPFPPSVMASVLPVRVLRNYRLLEDKLSDAVLMQRGILIPHPRDEYDLLEERLLENLDLRSPRILKCGHFRCVDDEDDEGSQQHHLHSRQDSGISTCDSGTIFSDVGDATRDEEEDGEGPVCEDCRRPIKLDSAGAGGGTSRWDINIYAANGLMRSGAWSAAWSEMERVDVEISPWVSEEQRRAMERRLEEEDVEKRRRLLRAEAAKRREIVEAQEAARAEAEEAARVRAEEMDRKAQEERLRLIGTAALAAAAERKMAEQTLEEALSQQRRQLKEEAAAQNVSRRAEAHGNSAHIPLGVLLGNCLYVLATDRRNIVIFLLGIILVYLTTRPAFHNSPAELDVLSFAPPIHHLNHVDMVDVRTTTVTAFITEMVAALPTIAPDERQYVNSAAELPKDSAAGEEISPLAEGSLVRQNNDIAAPTVAEELPIGMAPAERSSAEKESQLVSGISPSDDALASEKPTSHEPHSLAEAGLIPTVESWREQRSMEEASNKPLAFPSRDINVAEDPVLVAGEQSQQPIFSAYSTFLEAEEPQCGLEDVVVDNTPEQLQQQAQSLEEAAQCTAIDLGEKLFECIPMVASEELSGSVGGKAGGEDAIVEEGAKPLIVEDIKIVLDV